MRKKKIPPAPEKPAYQPTEREQIKLREHQARKAADTTPRMRVLKQSEPVVVLPNHPDQKLAYVLLMEALGTTDLDFVHGLIASMINATAGDGSLSETELNFMLAVIKGVKPVDQIEAMLAAQITVIHDATMKHAGQLRRVTTSGQDFITSGLNKCARTSAMLLDTLKRYRTGGQQTVTVQHVSVSEGGQAIVGNVTQSAPTADSKKSSRSRSVLTDARQPAMPPIDNSVRTPVPLKSRRTNEEG